MASNDWMLPVLAIGGLMVGGVMFLPQIMKSLKNGGGSSPEGYSPEEVEDMLVKYRGEILKDPDAYRPPPEPMVPVVGIPDLVEDDFYLITDEDFKKLDIGKKDRRFLNNRRKIRDARLERVIYGDNPEMIRAGSYFVNTVNPYGQGPTKELIRLPHASDQSRLNTQSNTVNLY